jgi:hypothetical protein
LGQKNNYTSDEYKEYWWPSLLRDIARDVFTDELNPGCLASDIGENEDDTNEHPDQPVLNA